MTIGMGGRANMAKPLRRKPPIYSIIAKEEKATMNQMQSAIYELFKRKTSSIKKKTTYLNSTSI